MAKLSAGFAFKKPLLRKTPCKYSRYFLRRFVCNHLLKRQTEWYFGRLLKVFITVFEHPPARFPTGFILTTYFRSSGRKIFALLFALKLLICFADMLSGISRASKTLFRSSRGMRLKRNADFLSVDGCRRIRLCQISRAVCFYTVFEHPPARFPAGFVLTTFSQRMF